MERIKQEFSRRLKEIFNESKNDLGLWSDVLWPTDITPIYGSWHHKLESHLKQKYVALLNDFRNRRL